MAAPRLKRTQQALAEVSASDIRIRGNHLGTSVLTRKSGIFVEEVPFKAGRHRQSDVNPMSKKGIVTGKKYVRRVNPMRPLELTVVTHRNPGENSHPSIVDGKQLVADSLRRIFAKSLPGPTDSIDYHVVGEPTDEDIASRRVRVARDTGTPAKAAKKIIDLSRRAKGLTIVISPSFDDLQLSRTGVNRDTFTRMVGIQASHPIELGISQVDDQNDPNEPGLLQVGGLNAVISNGGTGEVDLTDERQVEFVNTRLQKYQESTVGQLQLSRLSVATVVYNPEMSIGFDIQAADKEVAQAIQQANLKYKVGAA